MGMTENYLAILEDSLDKKIAILDALTALSDQQKKLISDETFDGEAFDAVTTNKGELIDQLTSLDNGFQALFDNVKAEIQTNKNQYADIIKSLQKKITMITEKSSHLQLIEQKNKELVTARFTVLKKEAVTVKKTSQMASNYYKMMNRLNGDPVFMDKKK